MWSCAYGAHCPTRPNAHLGGQPVVDRRRELVELLLQVLEEHHRRLPLERVALLARRAEREALCLDGDGGALDVLANVPVDVRGLAGRVIAHDHHVDLAPRRDARHAELIADGQDALLLWSQQRRSQPAEDERRIEKRQVSGGAKAIFFCRWAARSAAVLLLTLQSS